MKFDFWKKILSSDDPTSSKRVITLLMAAHFILTAFLASFFVFYLVLFTPKGTVNKDLLDLLERILENDMIVILGGLGFIGAENLAQMWLEMKKAKVAGNIKVGAPNADTINVETVNVEQQLKETKE